MKKAKQRKFRPLFIVSNKADSVPCKEVIAKEKVAAAEKLKAFMLAEPVRGVNIKDLIDEGRA